MNPMADDRKDEKGGLERILADRREKAAKLRALGLHPYANHFRPAHTAADVLEAGKSLPAPADGTLSEPAGESKGDAPRYSLAGRIAALRSFGKAAFVKLDDRTGRVQV